MNLAVVTALQHCCCRWSLQAACSAQSSPAKHYLCINERLLQFDYEDDDDVDDLVVDNDETSREQPRRVDESRRVIRRSLIHHIPYLT